jgi:glutamine---fructose-6-phosphate transaminase (isomerizing)
MKHGPIALIDEHMPVVAIATGGRVYDKVLSATCRRSRRATASSSPVTDRDPEELEASPTR